MAKKKKESSNLLGLVAYLFGWASGLVLYFVKKDDKFVSFHAIQSILLFGIMTLLIPVLLVIPIIGWVLVPVMGLIGAVLWLFLMYKAYKGEKYALPIFGDYAQKHSK